MSVDAKAAKKQRLADALRANLKRRKAAGRPGIEPGARLPETTGEQGGPCHENNDGPGLENKG